MKSFIKSIAGVMLASCLSVSGLTASAQTLTASGIITGTIAEANAANTSYGCVPVSTTQALTLTYAVPAGGTFDSWKVEGDFSPPTTAGNQVTFFPSGYGKIRVTVGYYINTGLTGTVSCNGGTVTYPIRSFVSKVYDINKTFTTWPAPNTIAGPTCVSAGGSVVYSINPIISTPSFIAKNIGIDSYKWAVYTAANPGTALVFAYAAGDGSAITFTAPSSSYRVRLVVGNCNGAVGIAYGTGGSTAEKVLDVTCTPAVPTSTNFPSCTATNVSSINFSLIGLTAGAQYTIQSTVGGTPAGTGLVINSTGGFTAGSTSPQPFTLTGINANVGDVFVTPIGGCNATPARFPVARDFSANNVLSSTPTCQTGTTSPIQFAVSNPPGAPSYTWTFPANWAPAASSSASGNMLSGQTTTTVNTTLPSLQLTPNAAYASGLQVTVRTATCPTNLILPLNVTGTPAGCSAVPNSATYVITRNAGPGGPNTSKYGFTLDATTACVAPLPFGSHIYVWDVLTGGTVVNGVYVGGVPVGGTNLHKVTDAPSVSFTAIVPKPSYIQMTVNDPNSCLSMTIITPPPGARPGPTPTTDPTTLPAAARSAATVLTEGLNVFPNPTDNTLHVELPGAITASLQLLDAAGRMVYENQAATGRTTVNVKDLPTGQYTLRVTASGRTTYRVVLVKH